MPALKWLVTGCVAGASLYAVVLGLVWAPEPQGGQPRMVATASLGRAALPDFTALVERVGPAVVNVTTRSIVRHPPDVAEHHFDIYRGLTGKEPASQRTVLGIGSGFVLGDDGYILTNAHVVEGADEITVRLTGKTRELKATVVGTDKDTDIALLKVRATHLPVAPTGSSAALKVGDWVAAIGSPFGFDNTITAGIISAKERKLPHGSPTPFLQSDVAINPGSSGGPLVNLNGEVVGINSKIYTRTGGYMGVSFAIPIETALKVSAQLRKRGFVARGFLGIETQALTEALATAFGLEQVAGALVTVVQPRGPAARAGLKSGDIVLGYRGTSIDHPDDLTRAVGDTPPGTRAQMRLWRRSSAMTAAVVLDAMPIEDLPARAEASDLERLVHGAGLVLVEAPADHCRNLNIDYGLIVQSVDVRGGPQALQLGDVIVAVNDNAFKTRGEFERLIEGRQAAPLALLIVRAGRSQYVALEQAPRARGR